MALTEQEKNIVRRAFSMGPAALLDDGYTWANIGDFLARPDVKAELELLQSEFNNQDALLTRSKFVAKRQLARFAQGAVAVLGQALAGPVYARDNKGNILMDAQGRPIMQSAPPHEMQYNAATQILNRLGVDTDKPADRAGDMNVQLLFKSGEASAKVQITTDPALLTSEEQALSRERVRNAFEKLAKRLPEAQAKIKAALGNPQPEEAAAKKPKKKSKAKPKPVNTVSTTTE